MDYLFVYYIIFQSSPRLYNISNFEIHQFFQYKRQQMITANNNNFINELI